MTPLHRTVVYSKDIRLCELLIENGANVNSQDFKGNTVLGALCDAFPLGIQGFLDENAEADPYKQCCHLQGKEEFTKCLLSQKDVQVSVVKNRVILF